MNEEELEVQKGELGEEEEEIGGDDDDDNSTLIRAIDRIVQRIIGYHETNLRGVCTVVDRLKSPGYLSLVIRYNLSHGKDKTAG